MALYYDAEKDPELRPGKQSMRTYEAVNPVVEQCLSELTTELQELLAWAETSGAAPESWGLDPVAYLSDALKLRNPTRAAVAASRAAAAAAEETKFPPEALAARPPAVPIAEPPMAAASGSGFSPAEAEVILEALRAGAVFSAGSRLGLVRVDRSTDELVVATPLPPPSPSEEEERVAYLTQARARVAKEHPPVLGTGLPPVAPAPTAAAEKRLPMRDAAEWLTSAGWEEAGIDAALAPGATEGSYTRDGMAKTFLTDSLLRPAFAAELLAPTVTASALDLGSFVTTSQATAAQIAQAVGERGEALTSVSRLTASALAQPAVAEALTDAPALAQLSLSPLGSAWVEGQTPTPPAKMSPAPAWAALATLVSGTTALQSLTTGSQVTARHTPHTTPHHTTPHHRQRDLAQSADATLPPVRTPHPPPRWRHLLLTHAPSAPPAPPPPPSFLAPPPYPPTPPLSPRRSAPPRPPSSRERCPTPT